MNILRPTLYLLVAMCLLPAAHAATAPGGDAAATKPKAASDAFPLRAKYIDVVVLETANLDKRFNEVVVVDVRTKYEYDTLRIKDAQLIPVTDRTFVDQVRKLRESTPKPIVFYCNGKTCAKSYDAVLYAMNARIPNVLCYDAGIDDWSRAHPERTALLGKSPIKAEDLIGHDQFKARLLDPKAFEAKAEGKAIVLDVRDKSQRDAMLFPFREQRVALEEKTRLDAVMEQAKKEKKTLLVYDQVGKQVQWFQYYLESKGLKDYYFMKGGAQGYSDTKFGKVSFGGKKKEEAKKP
jgi:rhodanese-related sulfurtransferase